MGKKLKGRWLDEPNEDDYAAAESFLNQAFLRLSAMISQQFIEPSRRK
jgi:hypothetical protein